VIRSIINSILMLKTTENLHVSMSVSVFEMQACATFARYLGALGGSGGSELMLRIRPNLYGLKKTACSTSGLLTAAGDGICRPGGWASLS
jgi:hypothetical protein